MSTISLPEEKRIISKIAWKLIPYIVFLYIISMIDRVNIGFAALTMNKELGIDPATYGLIAGIFFLSYFIFEVPSNVAMHQFGARKWIARILITWGIIVVAEGFVKNATQLIILRTLLGAAEAGFYPAMLLYLTYWFPDKYQGRAVALFMLGSVTANMIGGPISGLIMDKVVLFGMSGWRWAFILEGIPAIIFGILTFFILVDRPNQADFLSNDEKDWLIGELDRELKEKHKKALYNASHWVVLKNPCVWHMSISYLFYNTGVYALFLWMPQVITEFSKILSPTQVGFFSAIPYLCTAFVMTAIAHHSDKTNERRLHVALPILVGFVSLIALTKVSSLTMSISLLSVGLAFTMSFVGSFWTIPNLTLSAAHAAVGLAMINSVGNLGGFIGPYIVGWIKSLTGSAIPGMYFLALMCLCASISILIIPKRLVTPHPIQEIQSISNVITK
ncbi:MFS transporter [Desulfitobacterium sp. AusDCA]|uniref:MFS transporter n=1 Tax=Desulfitobacterium sp. AusDCA TaxID=3240383 RepID=UPI003DA6EF5F